jgi:hypothetical protein
MVKHLRLVEDKTLILMNKTKAKILSNKPAQAHLSDERTLQIVLNAYLKETKKVK